MSAILTCCTIILFLCIYFESSWVCGTCFTVAILLPAIWTDKTCNKIKNSGAILSTVFSSLCFIALMGLKQAEVSTKEFVPIIAILGIFVNFYYVLLEVSVIPKSLYKDFIRLESFERHAKVQRNLLSFVEYYRIIATFIVIILLWYWSIPTVIIKIGVTMVLILGISWFVTKVRARILQE